MKRVLNHYGGEDTTLHRIHVVLEWTALVIVITGRRLGGSEAFTVLNWILLGITKQHSV